MAKALKPSLADSRTLSGAERAAVLLLALGDEHGAPIWKSLDDEEVKEVSQTMSNLGTISSSLIEALLIDFVSQMSTTGSMLGSYESTERLLQKFLPEARVGTVMEEIRGPAGRPMWDKLGNVNEQVLASYLQNEYPHTVPVGPTKTKSQHSAPAAG